MEENKKETINLIVKWSGKEFKLDEVNLNETIKDLKQIIQNFTGVKIDRQKLLNLKFKGKAVNDDCELRSLNLKENFKILMMGSLEEKIAEVNAPREPDEIVNDLDLPDEELIIDNKIYLNKIEKRIKTYKFEILNAPRDNKKLLVLDIDYTIFDHRSVAECAYELMRPYLHEFLTEMYEYYDIMFWSATSMKWIQEKLKLLGVSQNLNYKIVCFVDSGAMITIESPKKDIVDVKPLDVIWAKFPQYSPKNTVMLDDIRRNFTMNPQSGLKIRPFRLAHLNRDKDKELLYLSRYLTYIACKHLDFTQLNHRHWEKFLLNAKDLKQVLDEANQKRNSSQLLNLTTAEGASEASSENN